MKINVKSILKYLIILAATVILLWLSLNSIHTTDGQSKIGFILDVLEIANKPLMLLSAFIAILSHLIRAERWRLLLKPLQHEVRLRDSFTSVMVGYFVNLLIPRGGELSRCYNLFRLKKTPINVSFGTVIVERVVDIMFLFTLISISFFIELDTLLEFFSTLNLNSNSSKPFPFQTVLIVGIAILLFAYIFWRLLLSRKRTSVLRIFVKFRELFKGIKEGVKAIIKLEKRGLFILYSFLIWFCYYLMSYLVMMAFPDTSSLTLLAALTIFVIGGIAMAVPLPGGAGSYHVLVPAGLVFLYAIPQDKAVAFTVIFHGWQTIVIILVGAASLLYTQYKAKHRIYGKDRG